MNRVWDENIDILTEMFKRLNLDYPGLARTKAAVAKNDFPAACRHLLDYYRQSQSGNWLRKPLPELSQKTIKSADRISDGFITCQGVEGKLPLKPDGFYDWAYPGPKGDIEWPHAVNRHFFISHLLTAFYTTGNRKYALAIEKYLNNWLRTPKSTKANTFPWANGLGVFARVRAWSSVFYAFIASDLISDESKLLLLANIPAHADYLYHQHAKAGNWITMEMNGLITCALSWPEFEDGEKWQKKAVEMIRNECGSQVYPDGVQKELASHYHWVTLTNVEAINDSLSEAGEKADPVIQETVEHMYNYLAYSIRPNGYGVLNNDSDLDHNHKRIDRAAEKFKRQDWLWITSNGRSGSKPEGLASRIFPWAGQLIMRSGWNKENHWAFFDIGPWGLSHQHQDKLHISVYAYGRDILVDAGRMHYKRDQWRAYVQGSSGHNTVLIDGKGQNPDIRTVDKPLSESSYSLSEDYDFARGTFSKGYDGIKGKVTHSRSVLFLKKKRRKCWIVVDSIQTDRPRRVDTLWHYHPDCAVETDRDKQVLSTDKDKGNIRIIPSGNSDWALRIVKGQEKPEIQGWYSEVYNKLEPNSTAVYSCRVEGPKSFCWLLLPGKGDIPDASLEVISETKSGLELDVKIGQDKPFRVFIPHADEDISKLKLNTESAAADRH